MSLRKQRCIGAGHSEVKTVIAKIMRALQRVRLVRRAFAVGFTLHELANILHVRDRAAHLATKFRALRVN